jgi:hypothetical protein
MTFTLWGTSLLTFLAELFKHIGKELDDRGSFEIKSIR